MENNVVILDKKFTVDDFEDIVKKTVTLGASDIHLGAENKVGLRASGRLKKQEEWGQLTAEHTKEFFQATLSYLDEDSQKYTIHEMESHGHAGYAITVKDKYRYRVNAAKYKGGYYIVLRTLTATPSDLDTLGFSDNIYQGLTTAADKKAGIFLVVGPTGSGKSTTLAAMIKQVNAKHEKNIITLEDPVEYTHQEIKSNIIQKELGRDMPEFLAGLKAALREDPDVILIGEIRDAETLNLALKAGETGHLVFSTLHTDNTVSTIQRIVSMTDNETLTRDRLSKTLIGVIAQRLEPVDPLTEEEARQRGLKPRRARILNYEMLTFSRALLNNLKEGNDAQIVSQLDNVPFSQSYNKTLVNYIKDKVITEEEALKIADDKKGLQFKITSMKDAGEL